MRRDDGLRMAQDDAGGGPAGVRRTPSPAEGLRALRDAAAVLDLDDAAATEAFATRARSLLAQLHAAGRLPVHLDVAEDDPPVVVVRVVARAGRVTT